MQNRSNSKNIQPYLKRGPWLKWNVAFPRDGLWGSRDDTTTKKYILQAIFMCPSDSQEENLTM